MRIGIEHSNRFCWTAYDLPVPIYDCHFLRRRSASQLPHRDGMAKLEGPAFIAIKTGIFEQLPGGREVGMLAPGLPREAMSVGVLTTLAPN